MRRLWLAVCRWIRLMILTERCSEMRWDEMRSSYDIRWVTVADRRFHQHRPSTTYNYPTHVRTALAAASTTIHTVCTCEYVRSVTGTSQSAMHAGLCMTQVKHLSCKHCKPVYTDRIYSPYIRVVCTGLKYGIQNLHVLHSILKEKLWKHFVDASVFNVYV